MINLQNNYDLKLDQADKDILISQLKAHIFELEQHDKNFDGLNSKYRALQNEYHIYLIIDVLFLMKKKFVQNMILNKGLKQ